MSIPRISLLIVLVLAASSVSGDTGPKPAVIAADHPALRSFGVDSSQLPAELYLVRTRGDLPGTAGVTVHAVRDGVFLVSGDRDTVTGLAQKGCAVFPISGSPAAPRSAVREWTPVRAPDPDIAAMVSEVNWDRVKTKIQWLVGFGTRYSYAPNHRNVAQAIDTAFVDLGLETRLREFQYNSTWMYNVVATQAGTTYPDSFFIICGHFDSISGDAYNSAPGADDNGTGTATVLLAAEILSQYDFEYSIRYICFGGEEQGLRGSQSYAAYAAANDIAIVGVLNFDMMGYWEPGVEMDLEIETNVASQWLAAAIVNAADIYTSAPYELHVYDGAWWGDHASFWDQGYAAVNHEEAWDWGDPDFNPYYHTTADTIGWVGETFTVGNVRVGVAALATLAGHDKGASGVGDSGPPVFAGAFAAYPNPFNESVAFTVTGLTGRDDVRIVVYDARGRRVAAVPVTLHDGAGTARWTVTGASSRTMNSGIYFGRLEGVPGATPVKIVYIK
jgi:hypothetical protein